MKFGAAIAIVLIVVIIFSLFFCIAKIPTGYTGIVTSFGKVLDFTYDSGIHFKAPWYHVIKMDNRIQKNTASLACFSSDIQEVSMSYTVNYQIDKINAQNIYRNIGKDYYEKVVTPCITESVKIVTAKYTAEELISNRNELALSIEKELSSMLEQYNINIVATSIEDIDFTDAFTDAVEAKQVAQQNKLKAQTESEQKRIEAQATADIQVIEARAKADATIVQAEAEAEANKKISQSLTDNLLQKMYYDRWNGILPTTILGDSSIPIINAGE